MSIERVANFKRDVENFVNTFASEELEEAGKLLAQMHPSLQQNFMRVILAFMKAEAEKKYYDDRNRATVSLCRELWDQVRRNTWYSDSEDKVYLPFI